MASADTIFALSSGGLPSGVAVVRVSGPAARFGLETLAGPVPEARRAVLRWIRAPGGERLDRGLALFFPGPDSVTGEDVAELHLHGGRAVVAGVIAALASLPGFRPAEAGEFTRRSFLAGRMDLTEVEGLADLIAAETGAQRRQALRQVDGALRGLYEDWRARLVRARALIEAELDFPDEDDVPGSVSDAVWPEVAAMAAEIGRHLDDGRRGERVRDGAEIVILGAPNAGKSSLINAIARREVAIVSDEAGTTRDLIEVRLDLGGYAVTLVDTAGLREASGKVEAEGIRRAGQRAGGADLVLWLVDGPAPPGRPPDVGSVPLWRIATKIDLIDSDSERSAVAAGFDARVSSQTGAGLAELLDRLERFVAGELDPGEAPVITRARHRQALAECKAALVAATTSGPLELRAEDLRRATDALGRLTGRVGVEDLLDVIFRDFCIGK